MLEQFDIFVDQIVRHPLLLGEDETLRGEFIQELPTRARYALRFAVEQMVEPDLEGLEGRERGDEEERLMAPLWEALGEVDSLDEDMEEHQALPEETREWLRRFLAQAALARQWFAGG
jgi:hypothetical protein